MAVLYVEARAADDLSLLFGPLESIIVSFIFNYCDRPNNFDVVMVLNDDDQVEGKCNSSRHYFPLEGLTEFPVMNKNNIERFCQDACLPAVYIASECLVITGLCATLRWMIKQKSTEDPAHISHGLLGFKDTCLSACAESSVWTKFCEVDILWSISASLSPCDNLGAFVILGDFLKFENHLGQPVRVHNKGKVACEVEKILNSNSACSDNLGNNSLASELRKTHQPLENTVRIPSTTQDSPAASNGTQSPLFPSSNKDGRAYLPHLFAEGLDLTLADIILFCCYHFYFQLLPEETISRYLPLTNKWFRMVKSFKHVATQCCRILEPIPLIEVIKPARIEAESVNMGDFSSLYKCDPGRFKPHRRQYTKQKDIETILSSLTSTSEASRSKICYNLEDRNAITIQLMEEYPNGVKNSSSVDLFIATHHFPPFDWGSIPELLRPEGGGLPKKRLQRKMHQLENIVSATLSISKDGDTIVDFCAGRGHAGLLLAFLLPKSTVIFLENKEKSLSNAVERGQILNLKNTVFYQSNLDYFCGRFDVGISLHPCGTATDLVIEKCVRNGAGFVCVPCCYGSLSNNHVVTYPRSAAFAVGLKVPYKDFLIISHSADQTHDDENAKTEQGKLCMSLVDFDRHLYALENNYSCTVSVLNPNSCSPKNHLLVATKAL